MAAPIDSKEQSPPTDAEKMHFVGRTQGDGMENSSSIKMENKQRSSILDSFTYRPTNLNQSVSTKPVVPVGTIVNLMPQRNTSTKQKKLQNQSQKDLRTILSKSKEPKFVPYEPYKAAINPIVPERKMRHCQLKWEQIHRKICRAELNEPKSENESVKEVQNEERVMELEAENSHLESQLKFQIQVNGELKNLLVAAVGEDLETKVHLLAEDKLQLARALLNSAQHLSTHQEQTEWLAGQCEVWRSKFLASSLMVEELAKWKAALCQRTVDLEEAMRKLLDERNEIRELSSKTFRTLRSLRESFDPAGAAAVATMEAASSKNHKKFHNFNILDLARGCYNLADILNIHLLSGVYSAQSSRRDMDSYEAESKTPAEKVAEQLLMTPNTLLLGRPDVACSAVVGAAVAVGADQMFFVRKNESGMACCAHCSGEIKQL